MPPKKNAPSEIFQLKVSLLGTDIWRQVQLRANVSLAELHSVLHTIMGWEDVDRRHEFTVGGRRFGEPSPRDEFLGMWLGRPIAEDERTMRLCDILVRVRSKVIYTYDFGDNWDHSIVLEKRLPVDPNAKYPICIGGEFGCPPEHCGGIHCYFKLLEDLKDPDLRGGIFENYGHFDPSAFSVAKANRRLKRLQSPSSKTSTH